ncbi:MAG: response regulator [Chitinophagaceae bacterium]
MIYTELKNFKPDVIILDVYIKSMGDGREICRSIKSDIETKNIPVILMSADYKELENYKECSADAVIEKPFNLLELTKQIESVVDVNIGNDIY